MIIFIAGIHGVGKSYLSDYAVKELSIKHATASQLIMKERGLIFWPNDKVTSEIEKNQTALLSAIQLIHDKQEPLLLDGHFVIRNMNFEISKIEEEIFRQLKIEHIVLVSDDPAIVNERLISRGDNSWSNESLSTFSKAESDQALAISNSLGIPLVKLHGPSTDRFCQTIANILTKKITVEPGRGQDGVEFKRC